MTQWQHSAPKFGLSEVLHMNDARKFSLNHEIESIAHKDE
jgi:hypothetical protein